MHGFIIYIWLSQLSATINTHIVTSTSDSYIVFIHTVMLVAWEIFWDKICHLCLSFYTAAKKIVACPPTTLFLGCMLQFSAVKDTSVVCETSEEHDSHLHVPLSSDMVMVEGLPDYANENSLCKALEKKGLPLPASLHVDDEEQVAYLQFDNPQGTKQ